MRFLPIKGYEGLYEVSDEGSVRSVDREVVGSDGTTYPFKGKEIAPSAHKDLKYLQVSLWKNGKGTSFYVHRLVCAAFHPNPACFKEVNHIDGCRSNNRAANLEWVSRQGNAQHAVRTGLKKYTNRLSQAQFIECLNSVINGESYQSLSARTPYQVPFLSTKLRKIARELQLEGQLDESLLAQRQARARINGAKNQ